ncbi:MAG: tRNA epoxyqueuosine(34) reductase QueG [Parvularculaceae bacterium]|nr:tRNA epoxyqueuosine(34) reductase QueG [Parvularculaceae bacterium]
MDSNAALADRIKQLAAENGFDSVGITSADAPPGSVRLLEFLQEGRHGDMKWLETRVAERSDPRTLWPEAQSIIMVGLNYGPAEDPLKILHQKCKGSISVYARGRDYHDVVKSMLKSLARKIVEEFGGNVKVFVDTAPVMEKPLASRAGLGWQGKHTNLVSQTHGSWLFLGAIFTTIILPSDPPQRDHCGNCQACLDICPTEAFPAPYQLDARRCISYLTIEHKGPIPLEFRKHIGNRIYGCDDCLAICPWNKFAATARDARLHAKADLIAPDLAELSQLDDAAFRRKFAGTSIKRSGRNKFVRNVLIAIGNSGDKELARRASALIEDHSALVRGAAVWALSQLASDEARDRRAAALTTETDETVLDEWRNF